MNPKIKKMLLRAALENPGVKGKYRMSAGVILKRNLISVGLNSYKTHPIMLNGDYREHQIYLHAEADAIQKALRLVTQEELTRCSIYVVRVLKDGSEALAKPCVGCMSLISQYGITQVEWTDG